MILFLQKYVQSHHFTFLAPAPPSLSPSIQDSLSLHLYIMLFRYLYRSQKLCAKYCIFKLNIQIRLSIWDNKWVPCLQCHLLVLVSGQSKKKWIPSCTESQHWHYNNYLLKRLTDKHNFEISRGLDLWKYWKLTFFANRNRSSIRGGGNIWIYCLHLMCWW